MFKRLREALTGRHESQPFVSMTQQEAIAFAEGQPCSVCGVPIDAHADNYAVVNSSTHGRSVHHHQCETGLMSAMERP